MATSRLLGNGKEIKGAFMKRKKSPSYHTKESLGSSLNFYPELFVLSLRLSRKVLGNKFSLSFVMGLFCLQNFNFQ